MGLPVEIKYEHCIIMFEKTFSIFASNVLPDCIRIEPNKKKNKNEKKQCDAFRNRINIMNLTKSYRGTEKFPYSAPQLAKWLLDYLDE